jgi:hypothetical protein
MLLLGGFLLNLIVTMGFHPSGDEDVHEEIFVEYANSDAWEWVHLGQLAGVLLVLAGLFVLYRALAPLRQTLATLSAAAITATAAGWAMLQGVDGVGLKQAVDAWAASSGPEQSIRLADAETIRWLEWGFQSYVRVLFGISVGLVGAGLVATRIVSSWIGWAAVAAGALSVALGVDVGYSGLASDFQDVAAPLFQLIMLAFAIGVLVAGRRRTEVTSASA